MLLGRWVGGRRGNLGSLEHKSLEKVDVDLSNVHGVWLEGRNYFYPQNKE